MRCISSPKSEALRKFSRIGLGLYPQLPSPSPKGAGAEPLQLREEQRGGRTGIAAHSDG